jgi:hypothetical protein
MTPRDFLEIVVRSNIHDFHEHYADLRHAHNAVSSVDALAAHIYVWAKSNAAAAVASANNDSSYRQELCARNALCEQVGGESAASSPCRCRMPEINTWAVGSVSWSKLRCNMAAVVSA